jgi:hypothetical protein
LKIIFSEFWFYAKALFSLLFNGRLVDKARKKENGKSRNTSIAFSEALIFPFMPYMVQNQKPEVRDQNPKIKN